MWLTFVGRHGRLHWSRSNEFFIVATTRQQTVERSAAPPELVESLSLSRLLTSRSCAWSLKPASESSDVCCQTHVRMRFALMREPRVSRGVIVGTPRHFAHCTPRDASCGARRFYLASLFSPRQLQKKCRKRLHNVAVACRERVGGERWPDRPDLFEQKKGLMTCNWRFEF